MTDLEKRIGKLEEGFMNVTRNMIALRDRINDHRDIIQGILDRLADALNRIEELEKEVAKHGVDTRTV